MRTNLIRTLGLTAAVVAIYALHPTSASARIDGVPEIGADAIGGAIAMVAGGLAVLRDRMRRR